MWHRDSGAVHRSAAGIIMAAECSKAAVTRAHIQCYLVIT